MKRSSLGPISQRWVEFEETFGVDLTRGPNEGQSLVVGTISTGEFLQSGTNSTWWASVRTGSEVPEETQQCGACRRLLSMKQPAEIL